MYGTIILYYNFANFINLHGGGGLTDSILGPAPIVRLNFNCLEVAFVQEKTPDLLGRTENLRPGKLPSFFV